MFITKVEFRELYSPPGGHNNFTIGGVSDVGEGEDPDVVLSELKFWVNDQLKKDHDEYISVRSQKWALESECMELKRQISNLRMEHRDQISAMNGTLESIMNDEIPF